MWTFTGEDMQELSFSDNSFDGLLNNHVLEHIPDDEKALKECYRVIRPGGFALFTLAGDFTRQGTKHLPEPDWIGHYRYYGIEVCEIFKDASFEVEMVDLSEITEKKYGVRKGDMVFVCGKLSNGDQLEKSRKLEKTIITPSATN